MTTSPPMHEMQRSAPVPAQGTREIVAPHELEPVGTPLADSAAPHPEPQPAATSPSVSPLVRAKVSPALMHVIGELDHTIDGCPHARGLQRTISLAGLRNMSHANAREFDALRSRLAELFNAAATSTSSTIHFVTDTGESAPFELLGAAYLTTIQGFDSWELFVSVSRRDVLHDLWRSEGPVRILRFEQQPISAQVFYPGAARQR